MESEEQNQLLRPKLAATSLFYDYLKEPRDPINYTLEEFGHDLGAYALRKTDADRVMASLNLIAQSLGTERLEAICKEGKNPSVSLKGDNFPNTTLEMSLGFLKRGNSIFLSALAQSACRINLSQYEGSEDYVAWENALREISERVNRTSATCNITRDVQEENKDIQIFTAEVKLTYDNCGYLPLPRVSRNALEVVRAVQDSYNATEKLKQRKQNRIKQTVKELTS
ncbi:MAG: hypothetical protein ABIH37_01970 [archaeon]